MTEEQPFTWQLLRVISPQLGTSSGLQRACA
jgi:hypothetical protein